MLARTEERQQDVVVLPIVVAHIAKLRIAVLDDLRFVAADENRLAAIETAGFKSGENAVENGAPDDRDQRLGQIVGEVFEPPSASCADDDRCHRRGRSQSRGEKK